MDRLGSLKPIGSYPTFNDGAHNNGRRAAADGEHNPDSWATFSASAGGSGVTTTSYAVCTENADPATVDVTVRHSQSDGPFAATTGLLQIVSCPTSDGALLGGGAAMSGTDMTTADFTNPGSQGDHLNGSYPSDASGNPLADGTTGAQSWTAFTHTGGAGSSVPTISHAWALCAMTTEPAATPTPTPTPVPTPTPTPVASPTPQQTPIPPTTATCGNTGVLNAAGNMCTYTTTGSDSFTVPAGVSSVTLDVVGARGGHYFIAGDAAHGGSPAGDITGRPGGNGGEATGILPGLSPGQVLQVDVAGKGINGTAASRSGGMMNGPPAGKAHSVVLGAPMTLVVYSRFMRPV
ncbi:MAG TPA: hypothetical protein VFO16_20845 [Pseudonocardiaceae bacterium]|nr:hypothetical protein [Pseudonocardiaceae bacterium]